MSHYRKILFIVGVLLVASALACSIDMGGATKPTVEILSPPSGTEVDLGQEVQVEYRATDATAVLRAELEVGGQVVDVQKSPVADGQPSLTGILRWTATSPGSHSLVVYAYNRERAQSEAVGVNITVVESAAPVPQPTPIVETTPTTGPAVLFEDDFSDPSSGWETGSTDEGWVRYQDGELHILNYTAAEDVTRSFPRQYFTDLIMEVESRLVDGSDDNWHTHYCRYVDSSNYYAVAFSADGYYAGTAKVDGVSARLVESASSDAINRGVGATNVVRLECTGNRLRFFVNGTLLIDVTDTQLIGGDIGLQVASLGGEYSEVAFDNLVVYPSAPSPAPPATPIVSPTPTVPSWPIVLSDDFNDPGSGFGEYSGESYRSYYDSGRYNIEILQEAGVGWTSRGSFSDFVAELDVTSHGEIGGAGIVFRNQEDGRQFCLFAINVEGRYWLRMMTTEGWQLIRDWQESPHIRTGAATNHLRLVCVGPDISLYVNNQYLETVRDTTYAEGEIGMLAGTWVGEPYAHFSFDNLHAYAPTGVEPPTPTRIPPTPTIGPVEFDPIIFSTAIDSEGNTTSPGTVFPTGTTKVYAVWACRGMTPGLAVVNTWYLNGQQYASSTENWDRPGERGRWWVSIDGESGGALPSGNYKLELYIGARLMQSGEFVIQ
jgi:hypothetical protein